MRHKLIAEDRGLNSEKMKHRYDKQIINLPDLNVGDLVLIDTPYHPLSSTTLRISKVKRARPYKIYAREDYHPMLTDVNDSIFP